MKKRLLLLSLIGLVKLNATAQTVVFNEDFATQQSQQAGWTVIDADNDTKGWGFYNFTTNPLASNHPSASVINPQGRLAISQSYDGAAITPDNYFISPAINLANVPTTSGTVTLKFKVGSDQSLSIFAEEYVSVYVVTNISSASTISANTTIHSAVLASTGINEFTYDISSKGGQTVYLVFRHHNCTDQGSLLLDDISVTKASGAGINETGLDVKVAPNPVTDNLTISLNEEIKTISFYDLKGTLVKEVLNVNSKNSIIDLSNFDKGLYFYSIETTNGKIAKNSIVKE
ncbi:MAG: choice-of-anchor J domain-containing protein [Fluviicola sp.]|jgi:hypothetical protein|nr:choice-of-anchor J domain-containing protein [Fluviicola sp.]